MAEMVSTKGARRPPRSRFAPKVESGMRIEVRDEQLLCDLFLHRLMSRGQIEKSYFSSTVRANARLRLLFDHGFVSRHYPPYAPFGAQAIYSVGKAALPVVSRRLEMDLEEVRRLYRRTKTATFIEHTLAVVDLWIALREALAQTLEASLDLWLAEMQCRHEWDIRVPGGKWHREAFKPDAFFRLEDSKDGSLHSFFLECDLGHTSAQQFTGKLLTHARYLESGLFQETYGSGTFQTLVVTTGQRRLNNLCHLAQKEGQTFFRFSTFDQIKAETFSGYIWREPDDLHLRALLSKNTPV